MKTVICFFYFFTFFILSPFSLLSVPTISDSILQLQNTRTEDSMVIELSKTRDNYKKIEILNQLILFENDYDVLKSLQHNKEMLQLIEQTPHIKKAEIYYTNAAIIYLSADVYDKALELFLKALRIAEDIQNKSYISKLQSNIGAVYFRLGKYEQALNYYEESLKIIDQLSSEGDTVQSKMLPNIYNNIGLVYGLQDKPAKAVFYMEKAIEVVDTNNQGRLGQFYNNISEQYYKTGNKKKAFEYASKSLELRESLKSQTGITYSNYSLAKLYFQDGDLKKATVFLEKAQQLALEVNSKHILRYIYDLFVNIYEADHDYKTAISYLKKLNDVKNGMLNDTISSKITSLKLEYDFDKKVALKELEIQKSKQIHRLTMGLVLLLLGLISVLYLLVRNRNKRIHLEKVSLEKDLESRNKELTTNAMFLVRNTDLVRKVTCRLIDMKANLKPENTPIIKDIISDLQSLEKDDLWNEFEVHFNRVHLDFYKKLKEYSNDLTPNELKFCAFLRINMSSKEISSMSGITVKSVEVMRSRIRKKLKITNTDTNLIDFLSGF